MPSSTAKVLVIDDHVETNDLLCRLIRRAGFDTAAAFSGEEGLAAVATSRPDIVILDQMMPGMNGTDVLRLLRSGPSTATLPIVMYSAAADSFAQYAMSLGATAVWQKGHMNPAAIAGEIKQILAGQRDAGDQTDS